jgi:hypothetical protein
MTKRMIAPFARIEMRYFEYPKGEFPRNQAGIVVAFYCCNNIVKAQNECGVMVVRP